MSGFRWMAVGRFAGQIFTWVITIYVIRILSPEDYGLMAMAMVVIGFLAMFDELGMSSALIQKEDIDDKEVRQVFGLLIVINMSAFLLLIIAAPGIANFFDEPRLELITQVLSLQFPIMALQIVPDAMIRRRMQFRQKSLVNFLTMILGSLVTLGLAIAGYGIWSLVIGSVATVTGRTIGYNLVAGYYCSPLFEFSGLRHTVTFGTQVTAERIFWFIYTQADIFLIARVLGKELLGYYSVAMHLASLPMHKLGEIVSEVSFSGFSRIQSDKEQVRNQFLKANRAIAFFAFPVFFGISATAPEIVATILGETWTQSAIPLQILSLIVPFRMLSLVLPTALFGTGRADLSVSNSAIAAVLLPVSFLIGLQWGLAGVCYAWLIGFSVFFVWSLLRSLPALGVGLFDYAGSVCGSLLTAGTMLLAVQASRVFLPNDWGNGLFSLLTLIVIGVSVFAALVLVFQRNTAIFVLRLIAR